MRWYDPLLWVAETFWLLFLAIVVLILDIIGRLSDGFSTYPIWIGFMDRVGFALSTIPFYLRSIRTEKRMRREYHANKLQKETVRSTR